MKTDQRRDAALWILPVLPENCRAQRKSKTVLSKFCGPPAARLDNGEHLTYSSGKDG